MRSLFDRLSQQLVRLVSALMGRRPTGTFTITIIGQPGAYTIEVNGPGNIRVDPQPFTWTPTPEQEATIAALASEKKADVPTDAIRGLGKALHDALFTPPIAKAYWQAQGSVGTDKGLRLRLQIEPPELASLPWEAMYDGEDWLAVRSDAPLVRTLPLPTSEHVPKKIEVRGPLRILYVGASPEGLPHLKIEETATQLRQLLQEDIAKKRIVLEVLLDATLDELRRELVKDYHILYFAGHGSPEGIYLRDGSADIVEAGRVVKWLPGDPYLVSAQTLAQALVGKPPRLVFLAACNTGAMSEGESGLMAGFAQELASRASLPAIVAMQYAFSDKQADQLKQFFAALAAFHTLDVALAEARKALIRQEQVGRDVIAPVMYLQAETGELFRKARNWAKLGLMTAVPFLILLGILSVFLQGQVTSVQRQKDASRARQLAAQAEIIQNTAGDSLYLGTLLAIESLRLYPTLEGDQAIRHALTLLPHRVSEVAHSELVADVAFSHDGNWLATASWDNTARVWKVTTGQEVFRLMHAGNVNAVAFSPDDKWLATASDDNTARVWDMATGQEVTQMRQANKVNIVAFSPDGKYLATGGEDTSARVWDIATRQEVMQIEQESGVSTIAFSPDSRYLATGGWYDTAHVWEITTGREVLHPGGVQQDAIAFSPDGKWLATESGLGTVQVWEMDSGQEMSKMEHLSFVRDIAFSPDGKWLATACEDGTARIWDVTTGQEWVRLVAPGQELTQKAHEDSVRTIAFSHDGKWLATGSEDGMARIWEVATGQEVARFEYGDTVAKVVFSTDGRWLATASQDGTVGIWEPYTGLEVARMEHENEVMDIALSPNGKWLATRSAGTVRLWEMVSGQEVAHIMQDGGITSMAFSPDGNWLATGGGDQTARVWETSTGREVAHMTHDDNVDAIDFSPDGKLLATGCQDGTARVWEIATRQEMVRIKLWTSSAYYSDDVKAVVFSPDGKWLATGIGNDIVRVWDVATGQEVAQMEMSQPAHWEDLNMIAFSHDGRWLAGGSGGTSRDMQVSGTVRIWEAATGHEVSRMRHENWVSVIAFSPDDKWLAASDHDVVKVWDVTTGQLASQMVHERPGAVGRDDVNAVAFSPDGRWLATGNDYTARIWNVTTGQEASQMKLKGSVYDLAFSPDGEWLITGGGDGLARIWPWKPEDLVSEACTRVTRNMTQEEWVQYFPNESYRLTCPDLPEKPPTATPTLSPILAPPTLPSQTTPEVVIPLTPPKAEAPSTSAIVDVDELIVYACPSETCQVITTLNSARGMQVEVRGCLTENSWCQTRLPDGIEGWCTEEALQFAVVK